MDLPLVYLLVVCCLGIAKPRYWSSGRMIPGGPGFPGGFPGGFLVDPMSGMFCLLPTLVLCSVPVVTPTGDVAANAFAAFGSRATAYGGTAVTGPGVGPMVASGIGTGFTSGSANVGIGDRYGYYGMGNVGMGSMGKKGMGKKGMGPFGATGFSGGFAGGPDFGASDAGYYSGGLAGGPGMGMVGAPGFGAGDAGYYSGGLAGGPGMGLVGAPGLAGSSGYFGGSAFMGGRWIRRGFYYFPFPRYCPWPSTPVFKINKRWWYCRIGYFKKF